MYQKQNGDRNHFLKTAQPHQPKILILGDIALVEEFPTQVVLGAHRVDVQQERVQRLGFAGHVAHLFKSLGCHVALASVVGEDQSRLTVEEILSANNIEQLLSSYYDYATIRVEIYGEVKIIKGAPVQDAGLNNVVYFDWPFDAVILVDCGYGVICQRVKERVSQYVRETGAKAYSMAEADITSRNLESIFNDILRIQRASRKDGAGISRSAGHDGPASLSTISDG